MPSLAFLVSAVFVFYRADRQTDKQTDTYRITDSITDADDRYTHASTVGVTRE